VSDLPPPLVLSMRDFFEHERRAASAADIYALANFRLAGAIGRLCEALAYFSTGFLKAKVLAVSAADRVSALRTPDQIADEIVRRCSTLQARRRAANQPTSWADLRPVILAVVEGK